MKLQEHRTITLPLAFLDRLVKLTSDDPDHMLRDALEAAKGPDRTSEQWAKIAAALELPDDRPTLDAVIEAAEGLAGKGESDLRLDLACALDELERHNATATDPTTRAWIAQARARLNGEPWHPGTQAVKPTTRIMDAPALTRDERSVVDENTRLRTALARLLGADAGTAAGLLIFEAESKRPVLFSVREAIKRAGLGDDMGSTEAIDILAGQADVYIDKLRREREHVDGLEAELKESVERGRQADRRHHVMDFATRAEVTEREVKDDAGTLKGIMHVLTWTLMRDDWRPQKGDTVFAGSEFTVEQDGVATRYGDVSDIPF